MTTWRILKKTWINGDEASTVTSKIVTNTMTQSPINENEEDIEDTTKTDLFGVKDACSIETQDGDGDEQHYDDRNANTAMIEKSMDDPVNHPSHYTSHPSGIECIEIAKWYDFCIGNCIKYLWRAGLKEERGMAHNEKKLQDLEKAAWYLNKEIEDLKKKINK